MHHGRVDARSLRPGAFQRGEPGAQRRTHPVRPVGRLHGAHTLREHRTDLVRAGPEHDDDERGADLGERAQRAHHQRLAVQLDERLRPAHPASRAGGQQQPRRGYRFTSVCGWT